MLEELWDGYERIRGRDDDVPLRVYRALRWTERGLVAKTEGDPDAACIFFWIAFNALYARRTDVYSERQERDDFQGFLQRVGKLDPKREVTGALEKCWDDAKPGLIDNKYVFKEFWTLGGAGEGDPSWQRSFDTEIQRVESSARCGDYLPALRALFDRLYLLRNQLHHGAATPGSGVNRRQVEAGATVMKHIIPKLIRAIIDNPDEDWGKVYYPVIQDA